MFESACSYAERIRDERDEREQMTAKIERGDGFIAALDQSGGSTPKALTGYGIEEGAWASDEEMFDLIHQMRARIITSPCFGSGKVIGAILFERTMDGEVDGKPAPQALIDRGVVPFIKIDKGLEDEDERRSDDEADARARRAARARQGSSAFSAPRNVGDQPRQRRGHCRVVAQQFEVAQQVLAPRPDADHRARGEHQEPRARRSATGSCSTRSSRSWMRSAGGQQRDAQAVDPGQGGPVRAAGRSSQGAARRRAVGRLQPRGSVPRAREESRHDRQLQPRACSRTFAPSRATRSSTARSAPRSTKSHAASTRKVPA